MSVNAHCYSNHDKIQAHTWPGAFVAIPNKGDYVEAVAGSSEFSIAKVCSISHKIDREGKPYIQVELGECRFVDRPPAIVTYDSSKTERLLEKMNQLLIQLLAK